jgi:hypothetical protein
MQIAAAQASGARIDDGAVRDCGSSRELATRSLRTMQRGATRR